jgi:aspartyl aminopeptidase
MMEQLASFTRFLDVSPTPFHAAKEITNALAKSGFLPLNEKERWKLELGKAYFVSRGGALVAAFRMPTQAPLSCTLLASHIDSPCLKLKPQPEHSSRGIGQFGTEVYGTPLLHSWLDRDLYLAGQISGLDEKGTLQSHLASLDDHLLIIPQLALHLDRQINERGAFVHKQDHLKPIFSLTPKEKNLELSLKKRFGLKELLRFDLFLVPAQKATRLGFESEMIASSRLDNLTSAYAALYALCESRPRIDALQMAFFWNHEEIGSMTNLGADSCFAEELLERICLFFKMDREEYFCMKSRSICLSGDLAHGFNPNFSDKYDPDNAPLLGQGPALKFNANQKYATSGVTSALIEKLARKHHIPLQIFASRSDIPSGSTVGPIMASQLGIATVDVGIAGWAMHSAREVVAASDELALCTLFKAALEEPFHLED